MNTKDYLDKDVYSVVVINGKKQIKMEYYYYDGDGGIQCVEFTGCYVDIPTNTESTQKAEEMCTQYQSCLSDSDFEEEIKDIVSKFKCLPVESVTEETECGTYIDCGKIE